MLLPELFRPSDRKASERGGVLVLFNFGIADSPVAILATMTALPMTSASGHITCPS